MRAVRIVANDQRIEPVLRPIGTRGYLNAQLAKPRGTGRDEHGRHRLDTGDEIGQSTVDQLSARQKESRTPTRNNGHERIIRAVSVRKPPQLPHPSGRGATATIELRPRSDHHAAPRDEAAAAGARVSS